MLIALLSVAVALLLNPSPSGERLRALVGLEERLADPVTADGDGSHTFLQTQHVGGAPVGWNPCRPVEYAVNPAGAPDGWQRLVEEAVTEVEAATGLDFRDQGITDDRDFDQRHDGLGRARPVLIGWADEAELPGMAGNAGLGGSTAVRRAGRLVYVTGMVALHRGTYEELAGRPDGWASMRAILLHELGHVVGLGHVEDPGELMHAESAGRTDFGPGDLEGLARLGSLPCG